MAGAFDSASPALRQVWAVHLAWHVVRTLTSTEMVALADRTLAAGIETPELLMLSLESEACPRVFETACNELGLALPAKDAACRLLTHHIATLVADELADPLLALAWFNEVIDFGATPRTKLLGESPRTLAHAYFRGEVLEDLDIGILPTDEYDRAAEAIRAEVISACADLSACTN